MQIATKNKLLKKVKRVQVYLFLSCKPAFAFVQDRDILC